MRVCRTLGLMLIASLSVCLNSCSNPGGETVAIQGAGATFPAPLYERWFADFREAHPKIRVNYLSLGSGAGIDLFAAGRIDFGASDSGMTNEQMKSVSGGVELLPVTAGSVVLAYNLPGFSTGLKLSREAYAGIFLGTITSWDDPKITQSNQTAGLPKLRIKPLHRLAASGTTLVFTQHLSAISEAWKLGPGKGMLVVWPSGMAARNPNEMVNLIAKEPGSIGYLGLGDAERGRLAMAWLQNKSGEYVRPSVQSGHASLISAALPDGLPGWIPDPEGKDCYPIVAYTWLLLHKSRGNPRTGAALKEVLKYCLTEGQKSAPPLGYIPLPEEVRQVGLHALEALNP